MNHAKSLERAASAPLASTAADFSPIQPHKVEVAWLPVGARARKLLRRVLWAQHSLEGLVGYFDQVFFRPLAGLVRIVPLIRLVGPKARRDLGLPIRKQLADLVRMVLVHGAKPWIYYLSECYRPGGVDEAGSIVIRNEIKHGIGKALNRLDPEARKHRRNLGDKLEAAKWCDEHGFPHARPLMLVEDGRAIPLGPRAALDRDLFAKQRDSRGARGVTPYRRIAPFQYQDLDGRSLTLEQITEELLARKPRLSWLILPLLHTHPELADLTGDSLLTFRALTCKDEQMRPVLTNLYLRSITKIEPRWDVGRLEEYGAPVDLETGVLGQMTGDKPECLSEFFDHHPVTGARVTGRVVPGWREMAQLAIDAHCTLPDRVFIGWDIAMTPDGPALLEGNSFADPMFPQRVFRQPIGHTRLGELLNFHLGRIEAQLDRAKR